MRRARRSRATGRQDSIDEMFSTSGLEADPVAREPDRQFPLRPFASGVPTDDLVNTEAKSEEPETERLYRRALDAASRGRRPDAILRYRELLQLDPEHRDARNNLSLLLDEAGDHDGALEQLTTALQLKPDDPGLLVSRGALHGRLKRYPEAEADLRRAIRHHPDHPAAHFNLGLVLWRKGLPVEAAASLRRSIELEPRLALPHYYLGEALNLAGDLVGARAALERSAELDATNVRTFQLLGRLLDRLNLPDEAREMYRRSREVPRR